MTIQEAETSLRRYVDEGIPTGGFLRACLANDLIGAVGMADEESLLILYKICCYIYANLPIDCHGSHKKVTTWIEAKRLKRAEASNA